MTASEREIRLATRDPYPTTADIEVRPVDAAHGLIITVVGHLRSVDAEALGRHLNAAFEENRSVVVVDLSGVPSCDPLSVEVLSRARVRARDEGLALHLVHLGAPAARRWLATATLI